jgi:membrane fusion protein, heavy metal efflux system
MKQWSLIGLMVVLTACQKSAPVAEVKVAEEAHVESATHWTAKSELFVEFPPLVVGEVSRFAVHLTRLDNFKAVTKGVVEVRLNDEVFRVEAPSRPGIFGVDVKPKAVGEKKMSIRWVGEGVDDVHELGMVAVVATRKQHAHGDDEGGDAISFLKEQQWTLDFATAVVEERVMQASLRVPAEVMARSGGESEVDAPFDGRVVFDRVPVIGSRVEAGQVLAQLLLPTNAPADVAGLELAKAEALQSLEMARKDRARAERLTASGAVAARRLEEARVVEANLEARLKAAEARLALHESSRVAEGGGKPFAVRAPIRGIVQAVLTTPGANVKAGEALVRIVDVDTVYVSAIVPEAELPRVKGLVGAELDVPGVERVRRLGQLITVGRVVDAPSRTLPVIYAVDNRERLVAINQTVYVRLLFGSSGVGPVVAEGALVDDGGRPIVFVQKEGEAFERRAVKLGDRADGMVRVIEGVKAGERVVTRGAHLIRLASMSSQVPAHGHVH